MKILAAYKTGDYYTPWHVAQLRENLKAVTTTPLTVLSDDPHVADIPLMHGWPGWWSKLEMFQVPGPCLYLDLSCRVVGSISNIAQAAKTRRFVVVDDFYRRKPHVQSCVMAWCGDMSHVYESFKANPQPHIDNDKHRNPDRWGDQGFIDKTVQYREYWGDVCPGEIVSYKVHCKKRVPGGARIICFHGKPKSNDVELNYGE